jgi:hypothetical protein
VIWHQARTERPFAPSPMTKLDLKAAPSIRVTRPAAVIHGRVGCHRGDGWNGQTAQYACSSRARSRKSLRGPEAELVIVDDMRYEQSVFDNMMLGLRFGDRPARSRRHHAPRQL